MTAESPVIEVWSDSFPALCAEHDLALPEVTAAEAEISEAFAARFTLGILRRSRWLRWRFPFALSAGSDGPFCKWLCGSGARKFGLSGRAVKKIRGAFRHQPGKRIYDIYLRDAALQRLCPLGLSPIGQRPFLGWMIKHGRVDQLIQDEEILWFLHDSSEDLGKGLALSYLVNPEWQRDFPRALTSDGWRDFIRPFPEHYPAFFQRHRLGAAPPRLLSAQHQRVRETQKDSRKFDGVPAIEGVNILSHFCYPSGIQQAALWAKAALERVELGTSCRDVPVPLKTEFLDRADWLGLEIYPVTILNVAPTPYFAPAYERSGLHRRADVYRIAYWAWELETIPDEWLEVAPLLDEIWAPTEFVAKAMRSRMPLPVFKMEPGVEVNRVEAVSKSELRIAKDHFVFLFMFDMYSEIERKNPFAVIRAFRVAFARNDMATLVIKVSRGHADPAGLERLRAAAKEADVVFVDQVVAREKAYGFIDMADCFVSLHRSEGFGLGLAEAMLLGKPAIATGYSGNLDFMNAGNSLLVDYKLVDILRSGPIYRRGSFWAEPSEVEAAAYMRQVFEDPAGAAALGARAQVELREKLSLKAAGDRMLTRLRAIAADAK
ncbi:MAG: glycosyltransferase [Verrucomicrobiota bacterium]|nr:glycosyltransferase [Verrucomicrobiota bacterium]